MKVYEPKKVVIEIEEEEMKTLEKAYNVLEKLSDTLENYEGKEINYKPFGRFEDEFYVLLGDMKDFVCDITNDW